MFGSSTLASLIREGKTTQIRGYIAAGKRRGMLSMDGSLQELLLADEITPQACLEKSLDKDVMREWLKEQGQQVEEEDAGAR